MQNLKFRVWCKRRKRMYPALHLHLDCFDGIWATVKGVSALENKDIHIQVQPKDAVIMQFSGKLGFNKRELYEGDIVFYEEAEDGGDKRYYLVIVWIPEWSMFASLHIDEYQKFIKEGAKALDESMFWTFTLEKSENYHYAGNIYQTPNLDHLSI